MHEALNQLGLGPVWRLRRVEAPAAIATESTESVIGDDLAVPAALEVSNSSELVPAETISVSAKAVQMTWEEISAAVVACRACRLCEARQQTVFGVGDQNADWLFIGEGPGAEEDLRGEPFVGQAGKLLDAMLASLGLARGDGVYIANAVKCRPPNNRTPEPDEIEACFPYLQRQVELIRPRLIVALGRPAAQALLKQEVRIGAARGKLFRFADVPVVVTYHPAYLLRNPADKAKAWEDLCFARKTMREQAPRDAAPQLQ